MQGIGKIELQEKPLENQASYSEESSTQVFSQICIPLIEDDVYSILDFFFFFFFLRISSGRYMACISGVTCRHFSMRNACIS
jgi:hypothetical protein